MPLTLQLHPDDAGPPLTIAAEAKRAGGGTLSLRYRVTGALADILLPEPAPPERGDALWRHTCFEAFVRAPGEAGYFELNLSPSGRWAAYRFSDYRMGMAMAGQVPPPRMEMRAGYAFFELSAAVDLGPALGLLDRLPWQLGLAAIIEEKGGRLSHWALVHPPGAPDFHHSSCFALDLPVSTEPAPSPRT